MDQSTATVPNQTPHQGAEPGVQLRDQLRELRRVMKAVRAGDEDARVRFAADGPLADLGDALNELADRQRATGARVRELEAELETVSRYRTEFLANVSHELRTPLNNLLILSGTLSKNKSQNLDDDQVSYATTIFECGRDLLRMINDMLDLGHVSADQGPKHDVATRDLVGDLEQFFRPVAAETGVGFAITTGHEVPARLGVDGDRVQQILFNLLSNAFKFTERGDVHLTISATPRILTFAVTDTGIGIPVDQLDQIFGAFRQVDGNINRGFGGTGLGLTISREIATALGAVIHADSVVGQGSTFRLELPLDGGRLGG